MVISNCSDSHRKPVRSTSSYVDMCLGVSDRRRFFLRLLFFFASKRRDSLACLLPASYRFYGFIASLLAHAQVIVVSFVRSNAEGTVGHLLRDWRRLNVALSRAKSKLLLIGSLRTLSSCAILSSLAGILKARNWVYPLPPGAQHAYPDELLSASPSEALPHGSESTGNRCSDTGTDGITRIERKRDGVYISNSSQDDGRYLMRDGDADASLASGRRPTGECDSSGRYRDGDDVPLRGAHSMIRSKSAPIAGTGRTGLKAKPIGRRTADADPQAGLLGRESLLSSASGQGQRRGGGVVRQRSAD